MKIRNLLIMVLSVFAIISAFSTASFAVPSAVDTADTVQEYIALYEADLSADTVNLSDADGDGFYDIGTADDLYAFAAAVNSGSTNINGELTADIELKSDVTWTPIGNTSNKYTGVFDGNNYTVKNLRMTIESQRIHGLFGYITGEGTVVKNFKIYGEFTTNLTKDLEVHYGVIGRADGTAQVLNVHSYVNLTAGDSYLKKYFGGIVGEAGNLTVDRCTFYGNISLGDSKIDCVGGIVGYAYNGKTVSITNCGFYGTITSTYTGGNLGGILGYYNGENGENLSLDRCLSVGTLPAGRDAFLGTIKNHENSSNGVYNCCLSSMTYENIGGVYPFTEEEFALRKALDRLNRDLDIGAWGQRIDNEPYPVICHLGTEHVYDEEGFCRCDEPLAAPLVTSDNYEALGLASDYIGYYAISKPGHLYWFSDTVKNTDTNVSVNGLLLNDITVNTNVINELGILNNKKFRSWRPIYDAYGFVGVFDGRNHVVSGLYCKANETQNAGLFYRINESGTVKNVGIKDSYISGYDNVGGIAGNNYGIVINCYNEGTVSGDSYVGGVVGVEKGVVSNCYNTGNVSGDAEYIGGVVGYANYTVTECYNTGIVSGKKNVGGVAGYAISSSKITNCYNIGAVEGDEYVGGFVGFGYYVAVENCYSACYVSSSGTYYGAFIGYDYANNSNLSNCFYDSTLCSPSDTDAQAGVIGKTTADFKNGEVAYLLQGTQEEDVWGLNLGSGDYPNFEGQKVYYGYEYCDSPYKKYSNEVLLENNSEHKDELLDEICDVCGKALYVILDLGPRQSESNIRYAEIDGVVTEIDENNDRYIVTSDSGEEYLLVEIVEKTQGGIFVKSQYFYVDVESRIATKLYMDSYMTADGDTSIRTNNPMGMRFKSSVLTSAKNEEIEYVIDEYGFIVATEEALGETELTFDFSKFVTGVAYNKESDTDIIFDATIDEEHIFAGYVKNIPVANYKTNLVCKTYTKITVDGKQFTLYGEKVVGNVYDTAKALLEDDTLDTETKNALVNITLAYENTIGIPGDDLYPES